MQYLRSTPRYVESAWNGKIISDLENWKENVWPQTCPRSDDRAAPGQQHPPDRTCFLSPSHGPLVPRPHNVEGLVLVTVCPASSSRLLATAGMPVQPQRCSQQAEPRLCGWPLPCLQHSSPCSHPCFTPSFLPSPFPSQLQKAHMLWDSFTGPASRIWARRNMLVTIWNQMPTNEECGTLTSAPKYYIFYYIIYYISPCSVSSGTKERLSLAPTFTDWEDFSLCCYLIRFEHFKRKQLPKAWPSSHGRDNPT